MPLGFLPHMQASNNRKQGPEPEAESSGTSNTGILRLGLFLATGICESEDLSKTTKTLKILEDASNANGASSTWTGAWPLAYTWSQCGREGIDLRHV